MGDSLTAAQMPEITIPVAMIAAAGIAAAGQVVSAIVGARNRSETTRAADAQPSAIQKAPGWVTAARILVSAGDCGISLASLWLLWTLLRSNAPLTTGAAAMIASCCAFLVTAAVRAR